MGKSVGLRNRVSGVQIPPAAPSSTREINETPSDYCGFTLFAGPEIDSHSQFLMTDSGAILGRGPSDKHSRI